LLLTASSHPAQVPPPPPADAELLELRARVAKLEGQVTGLESEKDVVWLGEERAKQIRSVVHEVLADSDTRTSLQDAGALAGWNNGMFIKSADGNFLLSIRGQMQIRAVWNSQEDSPTDDDRYGVEMRRAKLFFTGHFMDPSWQYELELDADRATGTVTLGEGAWVQKNLGDGFKIRAGQFKPMLLREEAVSARRLLGVERSQVNNVFTAGVAQGVQFMYEAERWRVATSIIDGFGSRNTAWNAEDSEFAGTARGEFLPIGEWKAVEDDVGFDGTPQSLLIGAAAGYQQQEFGTGTGGGTFNDAETSDLRLTADLTYKVSRFSIAGALIVRNVETEDDVPGAFDRDQLAAVLRAGFFLTDDIELYGMYEWGDLDIADQSDLSTLTLGVTKYWAKHGLKWQSDIGYGFNPVSSDWAQPSAGWRADAPGEDGQLVIRSQLQLWF